MMCVLVRSYTTFQDLLHSHPNGCFFANFEHCSLIVYSNKWNIYEIHICTVVVDIIYFSSFHCMEDMKPNNWPRSQWTQENDLAPNVWLHSSVARASHRYHGGHRFESCWSPCWYFSGFFLLIAEIGKYTVMITLHFHLWYANNFWIRDLSEALCQDSNLLVDTSLVDIRYTIFDTSTCAVSVTKSCAVFFYAFCFSVLIKLVVFGTLIH